jgi:hypothetical protein
MYVNNMGGPVMKRMLTAVAILAVIGSIAYGQSTQVLSRNAVGYIKATVPSNGLVLITPVFEKLDGSAITVEDLVGTQLPQGSVAHVWDRVGSTYNSYTRTRGGWSGGTNLFRGDGLWLQVPATSATGATHDVYIMNGSETTTIAGISGINAVGYGYPTDVIWTQTTAAASLAQGATIHIWDEGGQTYNSYTKTRGGWSTPPEFVITAGQGFWIQNAAAIDWIEDKPYTWPE